ncbi:hypothetical protein E2C01_040626 [Portunus trituberculatus]|uniref:Uncharacterized protein n=1 Tax=Portunus trituberculatus TaxID=210409 RepID=A0A5B7FN50_PORTR|nr:hypothetical protein [Portunus trituberculatus]
MIVCDCDYIPPLAARLFGANDDHSRLGIYTWQFSGGNIAETCCRQFRLDALGSKYVHTTGEILPRASAGRT